MRIRTHISGNEMMDILNERKPMCMVVGEWGDGAKMMMIFQEHCLPQNSNSSQTNGNIVISLDSSRYITVEVYELDDQELWVMVWPRRVREQLKVYLSRNSNVLGSIWLKHTGMYTHTRLDRKVTKLEAVISKREAVI